MNDKTKIAVGVLATVGAVRTYQYSKQKSLVARARIREALSR